MKHSAVTLDDKYAVENDRFYLTGTQALVRLPLLQRKIDVAAESFHFYSDSKEVTQLAFTGKANAKMSSYTSLALGTIFYQAPPSSLVVWFDDLAIDDNQVGCQ